MEKELFPSTDENKAKESAKKINIVFRMVKLNMSGDVCWLISETLKIHSKMEGRFSVNEVHELIAKRNRLFDYESGHSLQQKNFQCISSLWCGHEQGNEK